MENYIEESALATRQTVSTMCEAWRRSEIAIKEAHRLLHEAQDALSEAFDRNSYSMHIEFERLGQKTPGEVLQKLQRGAWSTLINKINIKKVMSLAKQKEVDDQLQKGDLPEINEVNVLAMLETNYNQIDQYAEQLVKEVYDWIRPTIHSGSPYWEKFNYQTNIKSDAVGLGEKVIIGWAVERSWSGSRQAPWRIQYNKEANFTALDNVFHLLDGKGVVKTHYGPLYDAVAAAGLDGKCETEYFRVKMFSNRNMHLQFKRKDLLARFNQVAGGMRLKDATPPKTPTNNPA